jgi:TAP-like protein
VLTGAPGSGKTTPSTSYAWALDVQAEIPGSALLSRDGDSHTSFATSPCAQHGESDYVNTLVLHRPGTVPRLAEGSTAADHFVCRIRGFSVDRIDTVGSMAPGAVPSPLTRVVGIAPESG